MKTRIVTGVLAGAGFLAVLALGGWYYHALLAVMAVVAFDELVRMSGVKRRDPAAVTGYAGVALAMWPAAGGGNPWPVDPLDGLWLVMLLIMTGMVLTNNRTPIDRSAVLLFGVLYIGFGFRQMASVRWDDSGLAVSLAVFACIWLTDAGAYFIGSRFGKRKLIPKISPNKSVEGAVGGLVLSVLAALAFSLIRPDLLDVRWAAVFGAAVGVAAQIGDLIQSAYKRHYGVKDSGRILPGHGGVLDRCDSWLIVFPFVQIVLGGLL
jgi:phosphatidate cytidylyltransferase